MRLVAFGASGRMGKLLVTQALEAGHQVVALAQTPSKLEIEHENLTVVQGDARQPERVAADVAGADVVSN